MSYSIGTLPLKGIPYRASSGCQPVILRSHWAKDGYLPAAHARQRIMRNVRQRAGATFSFTGIAQLGEPSGLDRAIDQCTLKVSRRADNARKPRWVLQSN